MLNDDLQEENIDTFANEEELTNDNSGIGKGKGRGRNRHRNINIRPNNESLSYFSSTIDAILKLFRDIKRVKVTTIIKSIVTIILILWAILFGPLTCLSSMIKSFEYVLELRDLLQQKEHSDGLKYRLKIQPEIKLNLLSLCNKLEANRVWLIELHNGTVNRSNTPFLFGCMTYEIVDNAATISELFYLMTLSNYNFSSYLEDTKIYQGSIEDWRNIDQKLYSFMYSNNCKYMALCTISSINYETVGYLGVEYTINELKDSVVIRRNMLRCSQVLSIILSNTKQTNGKS